MKVGIILTPYGEKDPAGLGGYILNLALALVSGYPKIEFVVCIRGTHDASTFSCYKNVTVKNMPDSIFWKDIAHVANRDVDVWIYNNPNIPLILKPKKMLVIALDFGVFYQKKKTISPALIKVYCNKILQHHALKRATGVLCISNTTRLDLLNFFPDIKKEKVKVSASGFTRVCDKYHEASVENLPGAYFLLVGVIKPRKNQIVAVKAFTLAKKRGLKGKLVISGKGVGEYYGQMMQAISQSEFSADIIYLGYSSNEQLVTLYKNAQALVFPSHIEGFGMPILEAMSCGTAVITSKKGAMEEVAGGSAVTVDSNDVEGFAEAMLRLEDDSFRLHYETKGIERANEFSWKKTAEQFMVEITAIEKLR